jgi:predicted O-linked N-acetylglucosamine transferase (SPINDLY family)
MLDVARKMMEMGRSAQAEILCKKALMLRPDDQDALHLLGVITYQTGNWNAARAIYQQLLESNPAHHVIWSNYGVVCLSLGDVQEALHCFHRALEICPDFADAWNNSGIVWDTVDPAKAVDCYKKALSIAPERIDICNNLALCYKRQQHLCDAITWFKRSIDLNPDQFDVRCRLAELLEQAADSLNACLEYKMALDLKPDDAVALKMETVLPVVQQSRESIQLSRSSLWNALQALQHKGLTIENPWERGRVFFYLAYHGQNDRSFHELIAQIYRKASPDLTWLAPHLVNPEKQNLRDKRLKVGFISRFFFNHTIAKLNIGYVEHLNRDRFHVTVLVLPGAQPDAMTHRFQAAADTFLLLKGSFHSVREQIAAQHLDVLLYTDIGMEPYSYFLAFSRLAPLQCVTWGHPATTGIDTVDYFISHADCETEESRASYTEKLFCLSAKAACTCYARPTLPKLDSTRAAYGIEDGWNLYYCPQPPFKLHPDFDQVLHGILSRDPHGQVLLLRGVAPGTEQLLWQRWAHLPNTEKNRIRFIDPLPFADYIRMFELADVILDTPHFSGGNSSVEALAVGAVVVTLPSPFLKGRLTYAWYRRIGITDCIAQSLEEYVQIAVQLATDVTRREALRQKINQRNHLLFDDVQAVHELEGFFEMSHNGR